MELVGYQPAEVVQGYLGRARAFLFAALEDFGISPVEAQACGTPVIAYGLGGATETVRDVRTCTRPTGLLFPEQTSASLCQAIEAFDRVAIDPQDCRAWAERFDRARFQQEFRAVMQSAWSAWSRDPASVEALLAARIADAPLP